MNEFDLKEMFRLAFGYNAPPFFFGIQEKVEKKLFGSDENERTYTELEIYPSRRETNIMGVPFYHTAEGKSEVFLPAWLVKPNGDKYLLQNTVMSLSAKKTMVETKMVNRTGDVTEEICMDNWEINIKGIIVSNDLDYPDTEVAELTELFEQKYALGIQNARTSLVLSGDEKIIIRSLRFPEVKGIKRAQAFEMNCKSDVDFSLEIN